jgi:hypothetical protein
LCTFHGRLCNNPSTFRSWIWKIFSSKVQMSVVWIMKANYATAKATDVKKTGVTQDIKLLQGSRKRW